MSGEIGVVEVVILKIDEWHNLSVSHEKYRVDGVSFQGCLVVSCAHERGADSSVEIEQVEF